jgi:hypothetical protein
MPESGIAQALFAMLLVALSADAKAPVPVMIGAVEDLDACPSLVQVGGAKSGLVSVRSAPSAKAPEVDRLANGDYAYACDASGEWTGVVYLRGKDMTPDCGVSSPAKHGPYRGPCKSGWVRGKWLGVVAG